MLCSCAHKCRHSRLLIEWEDTLPYVGRLKCVRHPTQCYSASQVRDILQAAAESNLEVIPLVQTFGHLEFVLKHERFSSMRESPQSYMDLCPLADGARELASELVSQVLSFHPGCRRIHVGCDEVFGFVSCTKCKKFVRSTPDGRTQLFLDHVLHVINQCVSVHKVQPFIWHDMLDSFSKEALVPLARTGVQVVIWSYTPEVESKLPVDLWDRLMAAGVSCWGASAYKGASEPDGVWTPMVHHLANHQSWIAASRRVKLSGIFLTGWTRFNHTAALCELLPAGFPCLVLCLATLQAGGWHPSLAHRVLDPIGLAGISLSPSTSVLSDLPLGRFPGAEMFQHLGRLESLRRMLVRLEENRRLFCPPFTRRLNPPMWQQLYDQTVGIVANLEHIAVVLPVAGRGLFCSDVMHEIVSSKVSALSSDVLRLSHFFRDLLDRHKSPVRLADVPPRAVNPSGDHDMSAAADTAGDTVMPAASPVSMADSEVVVDAIVTVAADGAVVAVTDASKVAASSSTPPPVVSLGDCAQFSPIS